MVAYGSLTKPIGSDGIVWDEHDNMKGAAVFFFHLKYTLANEKISIKSDVMSCTRTYNKPTSFSNPYIEYLNLYSLTGIFHVLIQYVFLFKGLPCLTASRVQHAVPRKFHKFRLSAFEQQQLKQHNAYAVSRLCQEAGQGSSLWRVYCWSQPDEVVTSILQVCFKFCGFKILSVNSESPMFCILRNNW